MKNKKSLFIIILILLLIILVSSILFFKFKEDNKNDLINEPNSNLNQEFDSEFIKDKEISGITFTNIKCEFTGGYSLLEYTITNTTNKAIKLVEYELVIKDKAGNIIANIVPNVEIELKPNEKYDTGNAITLDLREAHSIEIVVE